MTALKKLKLNDGSYGLPKNPRFIKDDRFAALCKSVEDNPEYMPARPIIVDEAGVILGGNMRYRACKHLKKDPIPDEWVKVVTGWSVEKKRRFIIMDNRGYGEDDFDALGADWELDELVLAGFDPLELADLFAEKESEEEKDVEIPDGYIVEVRLDNESEQENLYNELTNRGFSCKVLIL